VSGGAEGLVAAAAGGLGSWCWGAGVTVLGALRGAEAPGTSPDFKQASVCGQLPGNLSNNKEKQSLNPNISLSCVTPCWLWRLLDLDTVVRVSCGCTPVPRLFYFWY